MLRVLVDVVVSVTAVAVLWQSDTTNAIMYRSYPAYWLHGWRVESTGGSCAVGRSLMNQSCVFGDPPPSSERERAATHPPPISRPHHPGHEYRARLGILVNTPMALTFPFRMVCRCRCPDVLRFCFFLFCLLLAILEVVVSYFRLGR